MMSTQRADSCSQKDVLRDLALVNESIPNSPATLGLAAYRFVTALCVRSGSGNSRCL
jgi:hypothetical protein